MMKQFDRVQSAISSLTGADAVHVQECPDDVPGWVALRLPKEPGLRRAVFDLTDWLDEHFPHGVAFTATPRQRRSGR